MNLRSSRERFRGRSLYRLVFFGCLSGSYWLSDCCGWIQEWEGGCFSFDGSPSCRSRMGSSKARLNEFTIRQTQGCFMYLLIKMSSAADHLRQKLCNLVFETPYTLKREQYRNLFDTYNQLRFPVLVKLSIIRAQDVSSAKPISKSHQKKS